MRIEFGVHFIELAEDGSSCESNLKDVFDADDDRDDAVFEKDAFEAAVDGLESLLMRLAEQGVVTPDNLEDVTRAVSDAMDDIDNHLG
jgi:hypothetical protein